MATAQAAENHKDEWGLTCYLRWGIYTSIPTKTHSQKSLAAAAAEALGLKISSHGTSFKWSWRLSHEAYGHLLESSCSVNHHIYNFVNDIAAFCLDIKQEFFIFHFSMFHTEVWVL